MTRKAAKISRSNPFRLRKKSTRTKRRYRKGGSNTEGSAAENSENAGRLYRAVKAVSKTISISGVGEWKLDGEKVTPTLSHSLNGILLCLGIGKTIKADDNENNGNNEKDENSEHRNKAKGRTLDKTTRKLLNDRLNLLLDKVNKENHTKDDLDKIDCILKCIFCKSVSDTAVLLAHSKSVYQATKQVVDVIKAASGSASGSASGPASGSAASFIELFTNTRNTDDILFNNKDFPLIYENIIVGKRFTDFQGSAPNMMFGHLHQSFFGNTPFISLFTQRVFHFVGNVHRTLYFILGNCLKNELDKSEKERYKEMYKDVTKTYTEHFTIETAYEFFRDMGVTVTDVPTHNGFGKLQCFLSVDNIEERIDLYGYSEIPPSFIRQALNNLCTNRRIQVHPSFAMGAQISAWEHPLNHIDLSFFKSTMASLVVLLCECEPGGAALGILRNGSHIGHDFTGSITPKNKALLTHLAISKGFTISDIYSINEPHTYSLNVYRDKDRTDKYGKMKQGKNRVYICRNVPRQITLTVDGVIQEDLTGKLATHLSNIETPKAVTYATERAITGPGMEKLSLPSKNGYDYWEGTISGHVLGYNLELTSEHPIRIEYNDTYDQMASKLLEVLNIYNEYNLLSTRLFLQGLSIHLPKEYTYFTVTIDTKEKMRRYLGNLFPGKKLDSESIDRILSQKVLHKNLVELNSQIGSGKGQVHTKPKIIAIVSEYISSYNRESAKELIYMAKLKLQSANERWGTRLLKEQSEPEIFNEIAIRVSPSVESSSSENFARQLSIPRSGVSSHLEGIESSVITLINSQSEETPEEELVEILQKQSQEMAPYVLEDALQVLLEDQEEFERLPDTESKQIQLAIDGADGTTKLIEWLKPVFGGLRNIGGGGSSLASSSWSFGSPSFAPPSSFGTPSFAQPSSLAYSPWSFGTPSFAQPSSFGSENALGEAHPVSVGSENALGEAHPVSVGSESALDEVPPPPVSVGSESALGEVPPPPVSVSSESALDEVPPPLKLTRYNSNTRNSKRKSNNRAKFN